MQFYNIQIQKRLSVSEAYLKLPKKAQALILGKLSKNKDIKRDALLLEKDIWICWALEFLFKMPNRLPVEMDNDGETLHLRYPSVIEQKSGYLIDSIRLEFGGRNLTIPSEPITITADISEYVKDLSFPVAQATVLSPQKTYWEKLTLIHYECNRSTLKDDADRISRHWYDVAMLANHDIGKQAQMNRMLLNEVIKIKKTFYDSGFAQKY